MDEADDEESYGSEYSIGQGDDGLRLKYKTESAPDLSRDHRPLFVEESEVPISDLPEKSLYLLPIDDEEIREYERDEELREYDTSIGDILDRVFA